MGLGLSEGQGERDLAEWALKPIPTPRSIDDTSRGGCMMTNRRGTTSVGARALALAACLACSLFTVPAAASAQLNGNNARGDFGLLSAYQPDPGSYLSALFFNYSFSDIVNRDGETRSSAGRGQHLGVHATLHAHYGREGPRRQLWVRGGRPDP